jgi:uncharacterized membrane protein
MLARVSTVLFVLAALSGLLFTSLSTSDFVQHLDRQVHSLHCSFIPGATPSTDAGSGCHVALMSPWSSVLRSLVWGGIPVALPGIPVFAFLVFRGLELFARGFKDRTAALFLAAVTMVPVLTSIVFAGVAVFELETFCKTCAGIYASSAGALVAVIGIVIGVFLESGAAPAEPVASEGEGDEPAPAPPAAGDHPLLTLGIGTVELGLFVAAPVALYLAIVPDHGKYLGTCGALADTAAVDQVLVPIGDHRGGRPAIEVFDPLCPACKGFERRLATGGYAERLDRRALMFPLDSTCNWMVGSSLHPGACAVSEAVMCAGDDAQDVIDWAFAHQEDVITATKADPKAAEAMVDAAFPKIAKCTGSNAARQKLNRSLRWAVQNQLPVLTPQLYVDGKKVCDEDTDLGLDFALSHLLGGDS